MTTQIEAIRMAAQYLRDGAPGRALEVLEVALAKPNPPLNDMEHLVNELVELRKVWDREDYELECALAGLDYKDRDSKQEERDRKRIATHRYDQARAVFGRYQFQPDKLQGAEHLAAMAHHDPAAGLNAAMNATYNALTRKPSRE